MLQRHVLVPKEYNNFDIPLPITCIHGLIIGLCAGSIIALYRSTHLVCYNFIVHTLHGWKGYPWIIPIWFSILLIFSWIIGKLVHYAPHIAGSGVPEVELTLTGDLQIPWRKVLITKFIGGWLAILGGLSLGQIGPSLQMGALTGDGFGRYWFKQQSNFHIVGGAAAGICAACGAPIAAILLVFEQMKYPITVHSVFLTSTAVCSAQLIVSYGFGIDRMFNFQNFLGPTQDNFFLLCLVGIIIGSSGVLYNKILLWFKDRENKQTLIPETFRTAPTLFCAGIFTFLLPEITDGGDLLIHELPSMQPLSYIFVILLLKILFSAYSITGNVPGGIVMPILATGAILGSFLGGVLAQQGFIAYIQTKSYIIYGMAGFFAATIRAPFTSVALATEITGSLHCLPGTFLIGFMSYITANLLRSIPIYSSLKARAYLRLKATTIS